MSDEYDSQFSDGVDVDTKAALAGLDRTTLPTVYPVLTELIAGMPPDAAKVAYKVLLPMDAINVFEATPLEFVIAVPIEE